MDAYFEIFDLSSGNVVDMYPRQSDAIDAIIEIAIGQGVEAVERFALTHEQGDRSHVIAMKDDLVRLIANEMRQRHLVSAD